MKRWKPLAGTILILIVFIGFLGRYGSAQAQKKDIVEYLTQRFQAKNLPVTDVQVLQLSPLNIQVVIQSVGEYITPEDSINLHKIDREVFIVARQNNYSIERYTRILQNSQQKQLYKLDLGAVDMQQIDGGENSININDNDVRKILTDKIKVLSSEFGIQKTKIKLDVSSEDGVQALEIEFVASSLDEAYYVFGFLQSQMMHPLDGLIADINARGGKIVMCTYRIVDNDDNVLFFYFFDYQLQRGTWSSADIFQVDLGEGAPQ